MSYHDGNSPAPVGQSKREFLKRNFLAIGAIAVSVTVARIDRARASGCPTIHPHCCFLRGTAIRTTDGDCPIEELAIGQLVPTLFGGTPYSMDWALQLPEERYQQALEQGCNAGSRIAFGAGTRPTAEGFVLDRRPLDLHRRRTRAGCQFSQWNDNNALRRERIR